MILWRNQNPFDNAHPNATQVLSTAKSWLKKNADGPFFLSLLLFDPHHPYTPSASQTARFCPDCDADPIVHPQREYRGTQPTVKRGRYERALSCRGARNRCGNCSISGWLMHLAYRTGSQPYWWRIMARRLASMMCSNMRSTLGMRWRGHRCVERAGISSRGFVDAPTHRRCDAHGDAFGGVDVPKDAVGTSLVQFQWSWPHRNRVRVSR